MNLGEKGSSYEERIPIIYKLGSHYKIFDQLSLYLAKDNSLNDFLLNKGAIEIIHGNNIRYSLGISIIDYGRILPSLGFYYSGRLFKNKLFKLNYGIDFGSVDEGISHIFTWTFMMEPKKLTN